MPTKHSTSNKDDVFLRANEKVVEIFKTEFNGFCRAADNVKAAQEQRLDDILRQNENCLYGKKYGFEKIKNGDDFKTAVPITDYEQYRPYIENYRDEQSNILTTEPVERFVPTSGSTLCQKLIPYTNGLKADFLQGLGAWMHNLYDGDKKMAAGSAYWSLTPPAAERQKKWGNIPIGFDADEEYFGSDARRQIRKILAVPSEIGKIGDFGRFKYATQVFMALAPELTFISIWNPTFLQIILDGLRQNLPRIAADIKNRNVDFLSGSPAAAKEKFIKLAARIPERADFLASAARVKRDADLCAALFPNLKMISCWTHGNSKLYLESITKSFPKATIQPKGLIATEYLATVPLRNQEWPVLAANAHYFEFLPIIHGQAALEAPRKANELEINEHYLLVVTTSGGLYRYNTGDIVCVRGWHSQSPQLEFVGKFDNISDLVGEKLNGAFVEEAYLDLKSRFNLNPEFFMVAPCRNKPRTRYMMFIECKDDQQKIIHFCEAMESAFKKSYYYAHAVKLGQLGHLGAFVVAGGGQRAYLDRLQARGQKLGDIKNNILSKLTGWEEIFSGQEII